MQKPSIDSLTSLVTYCATAAALLCLVAGLIMTVVGFIHRYRLAEKAVTTIGSKESKDQEGGLVEQGALSDALDSVSSLASALKGLDEGTRVLVLAVAFLSVAAVAAGVDSVAVAVAK
jgi:hypothetical protein